MNAAFCFMRKQTGTMSDETEKWPMKLRRNPSMRSCASAYKLGREKYFVIIPDGIGTITFRVGIHRVFVALFLYFQFVFFFLSPCYAPLTIHCISVPCSTQFKTNLETYASTFNRFFSVVRDLEFISPFFLSHFFGSQFHLFFF